MTNRREFIVQLSLGTGALAATLFWQAFGGANAANTDTYKQLNLFGDVFDRVRADYVEVPDDAELIDNAINGMNITLNGTSTTVATLSFTGNYSGTINSLTLNEDSIIDLGGVDLLALEIAIIEMSTHTLSFKNWTGTTLWGGGNGSDTDRIYFGGGNYTLANVRFYSGTNSDSFLGTGYDLG